MFFARKTVILVMESDDGVSLFAALHHEWKSQENGVEIELIARIHTDFRDKFGIPRQSGLVPELVGEIVFEPRYRSMDALKGIEEFSYLWLIWEFSKSARENVSLTVAPPRLGGRTKKGVFATRSPFRPNPLGLSCVKFEGIRQDEKYGPVLIVSGVDLLDGTPIYDIKPYLPYADAHPLAEGSFAEEHKDDRIRVDFPEELLVKIPSEKREAAIAVLAQDPRAAYNKKPDYVYGMSFAGCDIRFTVSDGTLVVQDVVRLDADWNKVK